MRKFIHFSLSSLAATGVDLVLFGIFCHVFRDIYPLWYVALATILARVFSSACNYLINYKLIYVGEVRHRESLPRFVLLAIVRMLISAAMTTLGVHLLSDIWEVLVKMAVDVLLFFIGFLIQKRFIYGKRDTEKEDRSHS